MTSRSLKHQNLTTIDKELIRLVSDYFTEIAAYKLLSILRVLDPWNYKIADVAEQTPEALQNTPCRLYSLPSS